MQAMEARAEAKAQHMRELDERFEMPQLARATSHTSLEARLEHQPGKPRVGGHGRQSGRRADVRHMHGEPNRCHTRPRIVRTRLLLLELRK